MFTLPQFNESNTTDRSDNHYYYNTTKLVAAVDDYFFEAFRAKRSRKIFKDGVDTGTTGPAYFINITDVNSGNTVPASLSSALQDLCQKAEQDDPENWVFPVAIESLQISSYNYETTEGDIKHGLLISQVNNGHAIMTKSALDALKGL